MDELRERVADLVHDAWRSWMRYVAERSGRHVNGGLIVSPDDADRWTRQMNTRYADLPQLEKHSDRGLVNAILAIVDDRVVALEAENAALRRQLDAVPPFQLESDRDIYEENTGLRAQLAQSWVPVESGVPLQFDKPFTTIVNVPRPGLLAVVQAPEGTVTLIEHGDEYAFCRRAPVAKPGPVAAFDALREQFGHLDIPTPQPDQLAQTWVPVGNMDIYGEDNSLITTGADGAWITVHSDIDEPEYEGTAVLPPDLRLCRRQPLARGDQEPQP